MQVTDSGRCDTLVANRGHQHQAFAASSPFFLAQWQVVLRVRPSNRVSMPLRLGVQGKRSDSKFIVFHEFVISYFFFLPCFSDPVYHPRKAVECAKAANPSHPSHHITREGIYLEFETVRVNLGGNCGQLSSEDLFPIHATQPPSK